MLSIGTFSKISKVTTKTLRYYDEVGLLKPAHVNGENGYRYYDVSQLRTILMISKLKLYCFSLEEIAEVLKNPDDEERLFSRLVKKPVAEYIKLRRLAKATETLLQKGCRILDIALELGFSSYEHFSRVFKETFGMTPDEYRKNPQMLNYMTMPELLLHYTLLDEGVPLITEGIILEINRRENNKPIRFTGRTVDAPVTLIGGLGTESGTNILEAHIREFHGQKKAVLGIQEDSEEVGVTLPSGKKGYFSYFAGAIILETADSDMGMSADNAGRVLPSGFMEWVLPEGEYLVCSLGAENFTSLVTDALYKAEQICTIAHIFIMFYGGLGTSWKQARLVCLKGSAAVKSGRCADGYLSLAFFQSDTLAYTTCNLSLGDRLHLVKYSNNLAKKTTKLEKILNYSYK